MSAKLLQLVNSAFFGVRNSNGSPIASVEQAVMLLGMNTVQHLALASAVFSAYDVRDDFYGFSLSLLQRHALLTARIASRLMTTKQERDEAFVSGLLHDAGKLVLANRFPDAYRRIALQAVRESLPLTLAGERRVRHLAPRGRRLPVRDLGPADGRRRGGRVSPRSLGGRAQPVRRQRRGSRRRRAGARDDHAGQRQHRPARRARRRLPGHDRPGRRSCRPGA